MSTMEHGGNLVNGEVNQVRQTITSARYWREIEVRWDIRDECCPRHETCKRQFKTDSAVYSILSYARAGISREWLQISLRLRQHPCMYYHIHCTCACMNATRKRPTFWLRGRLMSDNDPRRFFQKFPWLGKIITKLVHVRLDFKCWVHKFSYLCIILV